MPEAPPTVQPRAMSTTERDSSGRFSRTGLEKLPKVPKPDLTPERTLRAIDKTTVGGRRELGWIAESPTDAQVDKVADHLFKIGQEESTAEAYETAKNYFDRVRGLKLDLEVTTNAIRLNRAEARRARYGSAEQVILDQERAQLIESRGGLISDLNAEVGFAREMGLQIEPEQDKRGTTFGERVGKGAAELGWQAAAGVDKAGETGRAFGRGLQRGRESVGAVASVAGRGVDRAGRATGRGIAGAGRVAWEAPGRFGRAAWGVEQRAQRFVGRQVERAAEVGGRLREKAGNAVGERVQGGMSWLQKAGERWDAIIDAIPGKAKGASELGRSAIDKFGRPAWNAAAAWAERHGVGEKVGKVASAANSVAEKVRSGIEATPGVIGGAVENFFDGMRKAGEQIEQGFSEGEKKVIGVLNRAGGWVDSASDAVSARVSAEWQRLAVGPSREVAKAASARLERSKESYRQSESGIMRAIGLRLEEAGEYCEPFVDRIKDEGRIWRNRAAGVANGVEQGARGAVRRVAGGIESAVGKVGREAQLRWEAFGETTVGQMLQEGAEHMRLWGNDARTGLNELMDRVGAGGGRFKKLVENAAARLTRKSETDSRTPDERKSVADYLKEKSAEIGKALSAFREYISARMVGKAKEAGMDDKEANAFMKFAGAAGATSARAAEHALGGTVVNAERMVRFVASHKKGTAIALGAAAAVAIMVHPDVGQWVQQVAQGLSEVGTAIGNASANTADAIGGVSRAVQEGVSGLGATGFVGTPDAQGIVSDVVQAPDLGTVAGAAADIIASPDAAGAASTAAGAAEAAQAAAETARTSVQEIAAGLPVGQENGIWNQVQDAIKGIQDPAQRAAQELGIMVDYGKLHSDNAIKTAQAIVDNASNYRPGEVALAQAQLNAQKALQVGGEVNLETAQAAIRYLNPALG